uniref:hypothetical protein n=1 Tax=Clostridioides difficile TaxID=1496 RepID=UPI0031B5EBA9
MVKLMEHQLRMVSFVHLEINRENVIKKTVEANKIKKPVSGVYDIDTNIDFGKYRGLEISILINLNPN